MVSLISSSWLVVENFNAVLDAHEALSSRSPARGSCEDFRLMIDDCDLVGIRFQGAHFTWVGGRSNHTRVERRLDRVLVSDGCISCWREISCVALPRICFDHCLLLVRLSDFKVSSHRPFRFQSMWLEYYDFIAIVRRIWSSLLVGSPHQVVIYKLRNLKKALKSWNWEVFGDLNSTIARKSVELHFIQLDLSNRGFSDDLFMAEASVHSELDVLLRRHECFYRDRSRVRWLRDGDRNTSFFHASIKHDVIPSLVTAAENAILTSVPSADDIHDAVFAMNAASAPRPDGFSDSFYQRCCRHIEDCIALASDCVNVLQKKCYGGNLAMKIDIRKAFDTLDWSFLCRVLQAFGFSSVFVDWIDGILRSSRLLVLFNGVPEGYFCCFRGVRQGDPLSPLLFGIAEDFLNRLLTRGTQKNLKHIMGAFRDYGDISGQLVNWVPLFRGKPRKVMLRTIADKILSKFVKWKGKSLSLAGRATLIRSVIIGSFVHSFMIYKWPSSLLSLINRKLRNFLWTGSCEETKLVRVA
ncbi:hypothetical protein LWI28_016006 [Acer negundo]|uniref:Reverse transcriptase domain-containing protein n=1 Tax=Acer negundo TaxID=4023 RepID=A0AAD5IEK4_ACENE|nr:hypothetical protein LWI28_016006 [Acer negundo]